jgi:hypothetical protein
VQITASATKATTRTLTSTSLQALFTDIDSQLTPSLVQVVPVIRVLTSAMWVLQNVLLS